MRGDFKLCLLLAIALGGYGTRPTPEDAPASYAQVHSNVIDLTHETTSRPEADNRTPIKGSNWWRKCSYGNNIGKCQDGKYCCCDDGFTWISRTDTCRDDSQLQNINVEAELQTQFQQDGLLMADNVLEFAKKAAVISAAAGIFAGLAIGIGTLSIYAKARDQNSRDADRSMCGSCIMHPKIAAVCLICIVLILVALICVLLFSRVQQTIASIDHEAIGVSISKFADSFLGKLEKLQEALDKDVKWTLILINPTDDALTVAKLDGDIYLAGNADSDGALKVATVRSVQALQLAPLDKGELSVFVRVSSVTAVASGLAAWTAASVSGVFYVRPKVDLQGTFRGDSFTVHLEAFVPFRVDDLDDIPKDFQNEKKMTLSMIHGLQDHNSKGETMIDWPECSCRSKEATGTIIVGTLLFVNVVLISALATCCSFWSWFQPHVSVDSSPLQSEIQSPLGTSQYAPAPFTTTQVLQPQEFRPVIAS